jgi:hypothetical protein
MRSYKIHLVDHSLAMKTPSEQDFQGHEIWEVSSTVHAEYDLLARHNLGKTYEQDHMRWQAGTSEADIEDLREP